MSEEEVPEGVALLPLIPEELGISPMFLAMLHGYVLLEGSAEDIINDVAATESLEYMATYLQRLKGPDLVRAKEDVITLVGFAKQEKWPSEVVEFLEDFLETNGVK
ncbi:hypothetical protein KIH39_21775 [Telmatocola sphagniphila]|jgi:hypothetical protein|uniref:Uncharacterized protein n=1 Tax=Telmatocola sphagniphila TaxID=1123043 RepID=A0A8E6EUI4_9BACT|nr:hypothetical protein [Telmatocola sphagniphila]QVL31450.1 hypothetical protein KIH39_21775 [Telmatocola sphagniphila]